MSGILAVWILAAKLPNSDLNFAEDFWVDFLLLSCARKGPKKSTKTSLAKVTRKFFRREIPLVFLQKPFLEDFCVDFHLVSHSCDRLLSASDFLKTMKTCWRTQASGVRNI